MGYHSALHLLRFGLGQLPSWECFVVFTLFMLLHVGNGVTGSAAKSCLPSERLALLQFKQSLSSKSQAQLSTWQNGSDCCKWKGISCDRTIGFIISLDIYDLGIEVSELDPSLSELRHLRHLDLGSNSISGVIPSELSKLADLTYLGLAECNFTGPIPKSFKQLSNLTLLDLSFNDLSVQIPPFLFTHPTLESLVLQSNNLSGSIVDLGNQFSILKVVDLSFNMLDGEIPSSISNMSQLEILELGDNSLTGAIHLSIFQNLKNLSYLNLSNNSLIVELPKVVNLNHQHPILPHVRCLLLSSCNIEGEFPLCLRSAKKLEILNLEHNYIHGKIPAWVWGQPYLQRLYLSYNMIHGFEEVVNLNGSTNLGLSSSFVNKFSSKRPFMKILLMMLSMSENNIRGEIPLTLFCNMFELKVIDLSRNNLTGTIPYCLSNLTRLSWLDLSENQMDGQIPSGLICGHNRRVIRLKGNQLSGKISKFLCSCSNYLQVLDLSQNRLMGSLPNCWLTIFYRLGMLDLSNNQLHGPIPEELNNTYATSLRMLNLNNNKLVGRIPRFLSNCSELQVINLGSNELNDAFPFWLGHLHKLRVLMLYSNKLYGSIANPIFEHAFSSLQILHISGNQLTGCLKPRILKSFSSMMKRQSNDELHYMLYYREYEVLSLPIKGNSVLRKSMPKFVFFDEQLLLNVKGWSRAQRVMPMLTSIDLSNNSFVGNIPEEIGALEGLYSLNLSWNNFDGPIPRSLGNLKGMESLDLSHNHLSGSIPKELIGDTFLSVLDLSYNNLQGRIPRDNQFGTFAAASFNGNPGLCGPPLTRSCSSSNTPSQDSIKGVKQEAQDPHLEYLVIGIGFAMGLLTITLPILFIERMEIWYLNHVDVALNALMFLLHR